MKGISKEFKIGVIVIVSLTVLIIGVNYLKGISLFLNQRTYFAEYENVDGLGPSNPVVLNGFKVGQVKSVDFHSNGQGSLMVSFTIDKEELQIPANTTARIFSSDFFGSKAIELFLGDSGEMAQKGDTLLSEMQVGLAEAVRIELVPLKQKTDQLIQGVDDILNNIQAVFEDDATKGLPQAFERLQNTLVNLEQTSITLKGTIQSNSSTITSIFDSVDSIATTLAANNQRIDNIIQNLDAVSDSLAKVEFAATVKKADKALGDFAEAMEKVNKGEGTVGQLLNSDSLHTSLLETNQEVQYLINDIYMNPWRYVNVSVFGKKPKEKFSKKELKQIRELIDEQIEEQERENPESE